MERKHFWSGFAAGAASVAAAGWIIGLLGRGGSSRKVRLEKSVQIGRTLEDVFATWSDLESLPRFTSLLRNVSREGDHSHWVAEIAGRPVEWDAEVTQVIPNQSIGWKSISGTRHIGRVTFSPLGDQTLVHVQMNYAPHPWFVRPIVAGFVGRLEGYIEQGLRDLKAALESGAGKRGSQTNREPTQATGTYGPTANNPRFGTPTIPVEFTRPPEAKS
jgi:uncharacterized membrane protein